MVRDSRLRHASSDRGLLARRVTVAVVLAALASVAGACSSTPKAATKSTTTTTEPAGFGGLLTIRTGKIAGSSVLENFKGYTLYWYALDKPGHTACTGSCAKLWRPFLLPKGLTLPHMQGLGTEKRPGGQKQVTYRKSPLYTYSGDTAANQSHGLKVPKWHVASVSASST